SSRFWATFFSSNRTEKTPRMIANVAVLGTGSIGMRHLNALRALPSLQTYAIPVRPTRLNELRDSGYATCADLAEATRQGVKALIIATDTSRHVDDALGALRLGLN